jgi:hypothetical protein
VCPAAVHPPAVSRKHQASQRRPCFSSPCSDSDRHRNPHYGRHGTAYVDGATDVGVWCESIQPYL